MVRNDIPWVRGVPGDPNGWSKSIVLENKVAINFDFRSRAKKSGHLDYPLQSYGPKFVNICKYFDSVVPAHHPMQYLGELIFFHTPLIYKGVWKNNNSPKYCIGWCARATESKYSYYIYKFGAITLQRIV